MNSDQDNTRTPNTNRWLDRMAELELSHWIETVDSVSHQDTLVALKERAKELKCVYSLSQMMERADYSIDDFMANAVDVFPPSWQFPEIACARIEMGSKTFKSLFYKESPGHERIDHMDCSLNHGVDANYHMIFRKNVARFIFRLEIPIFLRMKAPS